MTNCFLHPESLWLFILPTKNKTAFFAFNSFNKNRPSCFIDNSDANLHPYSRKSPITSNLHFWGSPVPHDRDSSKKCSNRCHKNSKQSNNNIPVHVWQAPIEGYLGGTSYCTAYSGLAPLLTLGAIFATMRVGARNTTIGGQTAPLARLFHAQLVFMGWMSQTVRLAACPIACFEHPPHPIHVENEQGGHLRLNWEHGMSTSISTVAFNGATLTLASINNKPFVAIRPICEAMGIDWNAQFQKIKRDLVLNSVMCMTHTTGSDNKKYEMVCLPLEYLNGWLFKIDARRVRNPQAQVAVVQYQRECYPALNNYCNGKAEPKKETDVQSLLKKINEFARVLITFDVSSGKQHVAALPEHIKMVDTHSESQILQLINCLDRVHFPMILDQVIQYFKECEKDYHRVQRDLYQLRNAQKREVVCTSQSK